MSDTCRHCGQPIIPADPYRGMAWRHEGSNMRHCPPITYAEPTAKETTDE